MAQCSACRGLGGKETVGGWMQCKVCGGSGQRLTFLTVLLPPVRREVPRRAS